MNVTCLILQKIRFYNLSVSLEYGFEAFVCFLVDRRFYLNGWKVFVLSVPFVSCVFQQLIPYEEVFWSR